MFGTENSGCIKSARRSKYSLGLSGGGRYPCPVRWGCPCPVGGGEGWEVDRNMTREPSPPRQDLDRPWVDRMRGTPLPLPSPSIEQDLNNRTRRGRTWTGLGVPPCPHVWRIDKLKRCLHVYVRGR